MTMFYLLVFLCMCNTLVQSLPLNLEKYDIHLSSSSKPSSAKQTSVHIPFPLGNSAFKDDLIQAANYASMAYCIDNGRDDICVDVDKNTKINYIFHDKISGIIMTNYATKEIIVSFKGTTTEEEWVIDFTYTRVSYTPYVVLADKNQRAFTCDNCQVHLGFYESFAIFAEKGIPIITKLTRDNPDFDILVTGHSLGGALAVLGAAEIYLMGLNPRLITLGGPKVSDPDFAHWLDKTFQSDDLLKKLESISVDFTPPGHYTRVTQRGDVVPLVPLESMGFEHAGIEIEISDDDLTVYGKYSSQREAHLLNEAIGGTSEDITDAQLKLYLNQAPIIQAHENYFFTVPKCHLHCR